uniref:NADH dehydrogenase [ubiquinone] 1 alpha subcomplex subunit 5 n=1 Tax=Ficedula albicollis TaxID=59894 RepID=U3K5L9_FICAL
MAGALRKTTGLVGLAVAENPHERLRILYTKILGVLQNIPKDAAYRKYTEQIVNERFDLVKNETDVQKLQEKLNSGQIEEVIVQAENELFLARKMLQWKPWRSEEQLPDMQYLIENIWNSQSALSASSDLYDLVMVRWDKQHEWSPWNTILLTKEEADVHLKLCNLQKTYEAPFIYKMEQKHIRAKNYFAQIPVMSSFLRRSNNQSNENSYKKHSSSKLKK